MSSALVSLAWLPFGGSFSLFTVSNSVSCCGDTFRFNTCCLWLSHIPFHDASAQLWCHIAKVWSLSFQFRDIFFNGYYWAVTFFSNNLNLNVALPVAGNLSKWTRGQSMYLESHFSYLVAANLNSSPKLAHFRPVCPINAQTKLISTLQQTTSKTANKSTPKLLK